MYSLGLLEESQCWPPPLGSISKHHPLSCGVLISILFFSFCPLYILMAIPFITCMADGLFFFLYYHHGKVPYFLTSSWRFALARTRIAQLPFVVAVHLGSINNIFYSLYYPKSHDPFVPCLQLDLPSLFHFINTPTQLGSNIVVVAQYYK